MTTVHRLREIDRTGWLVPGVWGWVIPIIIVWIWTGLQSRLGWVMATGESLSAAVLLVAARLLGLWVYQREIATRWPLTVYLEEGQVARLPIPNNAPAVISLAVPVGLGLGIQANAWGWTAVVPDRWVWVEAGTAVLSGLCALGTLLLYNWVIVPWLGPVRFEVGGGPHGQRIVRVDGSSVRRAATGLAFCWALGLVFGGAVLGGLLLSVLAHGIPAGLFGLASGGFAVAVALWVGFLVALLTGWWYGLGASAYGRWVQRGGGMRWPSEETTANDEAD